MTAIPKPKPHRLVKAQRKRQQSKNLWLACVAARIRDGYKCRVCGFCRGPNPNAVEMHHIVFRSHGGEHSADNLVTLCFSCHRGIHAKRILVHGQTASTVRFEVTR